MLSVTFTIVIRQKNSLVFKQLKERTAQHILHYHKTAQTSFTITKNDNPYVLDCEEMEQIRLIDVHLQKAEH